MKTSVKIKTNEAKKRKLLALIELWVDKLGLVEADETLVVSLQITKRQPRVELKLNALSREEVRAISIETFNPSLSCRAANAICIMQLHTVGDLVDRKYGQLMRYRNVGRVVVTELHQKLLELGIETDWIELGKRYKWTSGPYV